jgi:hypothetical protein
MAVILVALMVVFIFFRQELSKVIENIYKRHSYTVIALVLIAMSLFSWNYYSSFLYFVEFVAYNVEQLQQTISRLLEHVMPRGNTIFILDLLVRTLVFGLFIFFPEYYQKKYPSLVYQTQVKTIQMVCYYVLLILVLIFAASNL